MKATIEAPELQPTASPGQEEQRALVQRIVGSSPFRRSARLRDFLIFVAAESLRDPHAELNEQEIGEKVFGRPAFYNRSQDNIVRVNATELRRRIEQYFAEEGSRETLVLEIPRGGYKPVFRHRAIPEPSSLAPLVPAPPHPPVEVASSGFRLVRWQYVVWAVGSAVLLLWCGFLWQQNRTLRENAFPATSGPALKDFWNSFAQNHQPVDIVLPDGSASVVEDITRQSISLHDYLRSEYMKTVDASHVSADRRMDLDEIANHDLITFGDMKAAHQVTQAIPKMPAPHLTFARYYSADDMKRNNVIFIGGRKANPWVRLLEDHMNFVVEFDYAGGYGVVLNTHPRTGEQARYVAPNSPNTITAYSVVSYLPNPSQSGRVVVLAGLDADSTSAAAEFITSEAQMEHFRQMLKVKEFPYFEMLLRTSKVKGTTFSSEIVAYRTYPNLN